MTEIESLDVKLDRLAADLVGVIQSLRLMSDMHRQQGEQLGQIIELLTPQPSAPGMDLADLLASLVAVVRDTLSEVKALAAAVQGGTEALPQQLEAAIGAALARAEGARR
jgi:hypothetical protein